MVVVFGAVTLSISASFLQISLEAFSCWGSSPGQVPRIWGSMIMHWHNKRRVASKQAYVLS